MQGKEGDSVLELAHSNGVDLEGEFFPVVRNAKERAKPPSPAPHVTCMWIKSTMARFHLHQRGILKARSFLTS